MRVVFDIRAVQSRHHAERGISRYVRALGEAIERVHPGYVTDYLVDPDYPIPPGAEWAVRTGRCRRRDDVPSWLRAEGGVFLVGSPFEESGGMEGVLPMWARGPHWRLASVLYDLIPLRFPDRYLIDRDFRVHHDARLTLLRRSHRLLAISEASKADAAELLGFPPERVDVIMAGTDGMYRPPDIDPEVLREGLIASGRVAGLRDDYLLFTGGPDPRKNLDGLFEAFALLPRRQRSRHPLVVVCNLDEASRDAIRSRAEGLGIANDVLLTGFVEDRTLVELTQAAHLVVFPSLYEGFGLPVLEARRCGAPVICGDNSSLVEVLPDRAARFDASSPEAIAAAIRRALDDDTFRDRLRRMEIPEGFTWDATATASVRSVDALASSLRTDVAAMDHRPRVAVVIAPHGVPTIARDLVSHLGDRVDVTAPGDGWGPRVRAVPMDQLGHEICGRRPYDAVVMVAGSSEDRPGVLAAADGRTTAVVAMSGDFRRLFGIEHGEADDATATMLGEAYPGRYVEDSTGRVNLAVEQTIRSGMALAVPVVDGADHVFSFDRYTASLIELDTGATVTVLPTPFRSSMPTETAEHAEDRVWWLDGVLGSEGDDAPLQALSQLRRRGRSVRMDVVASSVERMGSIEESAGRWGVDDWVAVHAPGTATEPASVLVYVPSRTLGGVPEPVVQASRGGGRVVVRDLGSLAELRAPGVLHVSTDVTAHELADAIVTALDRVPDRAGSADNAVASAADQIVAALFDPPT